MTEERILDVRRAYAQRGFEQQFGVDGYEFTGRLKVGTLLVPVRVIYKDREFAELPAIKIDSSFELPRAVIPHVNEKRIVCFLDERQFSVDRYNAASEALGFLDRATKTLEDGLGNRSEDSIAREFVPSWSNVTVQIQFANRDGFAKRSHDTVVRFVAVESAAEADAYSVATLSNLSFTAEQKRPETFGEFVDWLRHWDAGAAQRLLTGLRRLSSRDPYAIVMAPNGHAVAQLLVSAKGLVQALERPQGWSRAVDGEVARAIPIDRRGGLRVDMEHLLGRNGRDGAAPLAGKHVVLIGCGSIGGFLVRALCQFGAGLGGGSLTLVDPDTMTSANIGRHMLGVSSVGVHKAAACRLTVLSDLPDLNVTAVDESINKRKHLFGRADLVVDATGEESVSEMLNEWRLNLQRSQSCAPALFHAWLEGQGAAARSFRNDAPTAACYRCLKPTRGEPNHKVLLPEAPREMAGACGDLPFTPYGPSAPMIAAGVSAQHVVDWALDNPGYALRTYRVDLKNTKECKPASPGKSPACPACKDQL